MLHHLSRKATLSCMHLNIPANELHACISLHRMHIYGFTPHRPFSFNYFCFMLVLDLLFIKALEHKKKTSDRSITRFKKTDLSQSFRSNTSGNNRATFVSFEQLRSVIRTQNLYTGSICNDSQQTSLLVEAEMRLCLEVIPKRKSFSGTIANNL